VRHENHRDINRKTSRGASEQPSRHHEAFSRWGEDFGDDTAAEVIIDRLVHQAEVINLTDDRYRLKGRDLGKLRFNDA